MKIAITGTIGSGKTEVCNYLKTKGYDVFDCDKINGELLDTKAYELLSDHFPQCFDNNRVLDRNKLSNIVFADEDSRKLLESIMHPLILEQLQKRNDDPLFAEVPLLFETGWDKYFDESLLIVVEEDLAIERLKNREIDEKVAKMRISNQMPVQEKIKKASRIIYNNGSLDELYTAIDNYLLEIC